MAIFPTAVSSDSDLFVAVNMVSTQLTDNPLTIGATTVNVVDASAFPSVGYLSIDNEIIKYAAKTGTSFTGCTRAADGTVASAHVQNSQIFHNVIANHHNALKEEIKAIEQNLSDRIGLSSTQILAPAGTTSAPAFSFGADQDTGIYRIGANQIGIVAGGVNKLFINSVGGLVTLAGYIHNSDGSVAAPAYAFNSDPDTGVYSGGTNNLSIASGGVRSAYFSGAGCGLLGTLINDSASGGYVGEHISAVSGSTVALTTGTYADTASITLSAGDWDISLLEWFTGGAITGTIVYGGISTSSGNSGSGLSVATAAQLPIVPTASSDVALVVPSYRVSIASSTTYYAKAFSTFSAGTVSASARISARRVR